MPNISWNINAWNNKYDWKGQGEEWSACWGSSFSQWLTTIYPRIGCFFPAESVLEIAPGFGRWSRFLIQGSSVYRGVDISEKCIEACKARFENAAHAKFFVNNGKSLDLISDMQYNFVFSFDSLVHVEMDVLQEYIRQIINLLAPNGVAFLHHSNFGMYADGAANNRHARATSVTAASVEKVIVEQGGHLLTQETLTWGEKNVLNDCFSLFARSGDYSNIKTRKLVSNMFSEKEVTWAKDVISNYHL
jgi:2-polyprenyl-3-methyl-5-hydroxy-6-metoxy-1,4-benzoquinol methylase